MINRSYWSYVHQLRYRLGAPHSMNSPCPLSYSHATSSTAAQLRCFERGSASGILEIGCLKKKSRISCQNKTCSKMLIYNYLYIYMTFIYINDTHIYIYMYIWHIYIYMYIWHTHIYIYACRNACIHILYRHGCCTYYAHVSKWSAKKNMSIFRVSRSCWKITAYDTLW